MIVSYCDIQIKLYKLKVLKKHENRVLVSNANKGITINSSIEMIYKVQVYDLSGRSLCQKMNVNNYEFIVQNLGLTHQVLLIKILLNEGQIVTNKIIY